MKNKGSIIIGALLLMASGIYAQLTSDTQAKTEFKTKSGWTLTMESGSNRSVISDQKGKPLGFVDIDKNGNAYVQKL